MTACNTNQTAQRIVIEEENDVAESDDDEEADEDSDSEEVPDNDMEDESDSENEDDKEVEEDSTSLDEDDVKKSDTDKEGNEDSGAADENTDDGSDAEISGAQYVGEYNSYDIDEPELQIEQQDDGTFIIQIGIYRLIQLYDCVGTLTDEGLEFYTTELGDNDIRGIVTLDGDVATVTFTSSDWSNYSSIDEYKYHKTSDVPNIYFPSYMNK